MACRRKISSNVTGSTEETRGGGSRLIFALSPRPPLETPLSSLGSHCRLVPSPTDCFNYEKHTWKLLRHFLFWFRFVIYCSKKNPKKCLSHATDCNLKKVKEKIVLNAYPHLVRCNSVIIKQNGEQKAPLLYFQTILIIVVECAVRLMLSAEVWEVILSFWNKIPVWGGCGHRTLPESVRSGLNWFPDKSTYSGFISVEKYKFILTNIFMYINISSTLEC